MLRFACLLPVAANVGSMRCVAAHHQPERLVEQGREGQRGDRQEQRADPEGFEGVG